MTEREDDYDIDPDDPDGSIGRRLEAERVLAWWRAPTEKRNWIYFQFPDYVSANDVNARRVPEE